ncbi:Cyclin-like F-box [Beauveria brongniartii RCEF 3172]|uniref:Cyclin-like F-box n=1 Tax=Beauveria brongniartii RCEF 3172 TaxID=1081107 RepID=A0A166S5M2_9HYPO|nr:Cyclin-like F-box [Beauveria brongniartii RCEF 3172]
MSSDVKTETRNPSHQDMERRLSEIVLNRPPGIPPHAYSPCTPRAALSGPAWTRLHSAPRENFKNSPLLSLPDSLVTKIMSFTNQDSLLRLRHTSRTFMRLFSLSDEFAHLRVADCTEGAEFRANIWRMPNCTYPEQRESKLCSSCEDIRGYNEQAPQSCIGWAGHVKLCSDVLLDWDLVVALSDCTSDESNGVGCNQHDENGWNCSRKKCTSENGLKFLVWPRIDGRYELQFTSASHIPFNRGPSGEKPGWYGVFSALHEVKNPKDPYCFLASRRFEGCDPMRMFDPSICSCLDWSVLPRETDTNTQHCFKWHLGGHNCRSWRWGADQERNEYAGSEITECDPETDRCHGARHGFDAYMGPGRQVNVDFINCPDDGNMLVLVQRTTLIVEGPTDPNWLQLICPQSILQTRDTDMLGKTWCHSKDCAVSKKPGCNKRRSLLELEWKLSHPNWGADFDNAADEYYDDEEEEEEEMSDDDGDDSNEAIDSVEEEGSEPRNGFDGAIDADWVLVTAGEDDVDEETIRTALVLDSGPSLYSEQLLDYHFLLF